MSTKIKDLVGYTHSDFARILDGRKNTFYVFHLGSCVILGESKKQPIMTLFIKKRKICSSDISNMPNNMVTKIFGWALAGIRRFNNNLC